MKWPPPSPPRPTARAVHQAGAQRLARHVLAGAAGGSGHRRRARGLWAGGARGCRGLFDAGLLTGGQHKLHLGLTEDIPFLKNQERLTFARVGIIDPLSLDDYWRMKVMPA
jgi:hypothetical protein